MADGFFNAPDHDYPSYIELIADRDGRRRQVRNDERSAGSAKTVDLTFVSSPPGLGLAVGLDPPVAAPFTKRVIVNSVVGVAPRARRSSAGTTYAFNNWSDGGLASHTVVAPAAPTTYTATFDATAGSVTSYLSDLAYTVVSNGFGPAEKDRSNGEAGAADGRPLTLAGVVYPKGIGVHAPSEIRYNLTGCSTFTTKVGLDDEVGSQRLAQLPDLGRRGQARRQRDHDRRPARPRP